MHPTEERAKVPEDRNLTTGRRPKAWEWALLFGGYVPAFLAFWAWILVLPWYRLPGLIGVYGFSVGFVAPDRVLYYLGASAVLLCHLAVVLGCFPKPEGRIPRRLLCTSLMAAILSLGLVATVADLAGLWWEFAYLWFWPSGFIPSVGADMIKLSLLFALCWAAWIVVLQRARRADAHDVSRITRYLIAGATAELILAGIAMARLPAEVYDKRAWLVFPAYHWFGAYTGIVLGFYVLLCAIGVQMLLRFRRWLPDSVAK